jgi:pimeloyl-ACP methyl ester carboxylesterase
MQPVPFLIDVSDEVLGDLYTRLARSRLPDRTPGEVWAAGTDPGYLRELIDYWTEKYDWRAQQRVLNGFTQFRVSIGGRQLHYVHVRAARRSENPAPLPLLLSHGWPSTFTEMLPLVPMLTDPVSLGRDELDTFDVIIPSLPGITYSQLPVSGPLTRPVIADLWATLMTEVLGYPRFGLYGGDIGSDVNHWLGIRHPEKVVGLHTIHPKLPTVIDPAQPLTEAERGYLRGREVEDETDGGYSHMQATRPDTLAAALLDSPAGLAAWIVEKFRAWGDCDGDIERRFSKDVLLTIIMLYWVTESIGSSFRTYYDYDHNPQRPARITIPVGVTLSAEDINYPRELANRTYTDIRMWHNPGRGGHFFPLEEPEMLASDIRAFFRPLRKN